MNVEDKLSSGSDDGGDTSLDPDSNCGITISAEESDHSVVKVCKSSEANNFSQKNEGLEGDKDPCLLGREKRLEVLKNLESDPSMVQVDADKREGSLFEERNDSISRISQILEEDEDPCFVHREKRLKMSNPEHSEPHVMQVEIGLTLEAPDSFSDLKNSSLVVPEAHCSYKDVDKTIRTSGGGLSGEVSENGLLPKACGCNSGFHESSQNNDAELASKLDARSENHEIDMLAPMENHRISDDAMDSMECNTIDGHELIGTTSIKGCSISCSQPLDKDELPSATNFATVNNKDPSDCSEICDDSNESNHVGRDIDKFEKQEFSSVDTLCKDTSSHHEERSLAMGLIDSTFQGMDRSANVAVNGDSSSSSSSRKKLLVLDVNGLLVAILSYMPYDYDFDEIINRRAVFLRPHCHDFLKFCFERFKVGIWTSRTRRNLEPIIDFILGDDKQKLAFTWDHSHCTDSGFYMVEKKTKPLFVKRLKKLWNKCEPDLPWEKGEYDETNTVLVDDTPSKALSNPPYNAIFPTSFRFSDVTDNSLGPGGDLRVYLEELSMAENVQEYIQQHPFGQRPITEKNLSWRYYLKVIEAVSTPPRQEEPEASQEEHKATNTDESRE